MTERVTTFTKRREAAEPGSIPDVLQMFTREVRFYREVAPYVGLRTPACYLAEEQDGATHLELEDLSSRRLGAEPDVAARTLRDLHARWEGSAVERWPWLPRPDVSHLVEALYDDAWASARRRRRSRTRSATWVTRSSAAWPRWSNVPRRAGRSRSRTVTPRP
jgi:hypothetical protein